MPVVVQRLIHISDGCRNKIMLCQFVLHFGASKLSREGAEFTVQRVGVVVCDGVG